MKTLQEITGKSSGFYMEYGQAVLIDWTNMPATFMLIASENVSSCTKYLEARWGYKESAFINDRGELQFVRKLNVVEDTGWFEPHEIDRPGVLYHLQSDYGSLVDVLIPD